jgi:hypothetical protein
MRVLVVDDEPPARVTGTYAEFPTGVRAHVRLG